MLTACTRFGANPDDAAIKKFAASPQYSISSEYFVNTTPDVIKNMNERSMSFSLLKEWFFSSNNREPSYKLPEAVPDIQEFIRPSTDLKVIWLGHSTILMNMSGRIVLFDPVFSGAASPVSFFVQRFQPAALRLEDLPPVDFIVISHDHYDHLDMKTVRYFADKPTEFIVPLGVGSHLKEWGISKNLITELDWWESTQAKSITFTATPAQHFSGRGLSQNKTLWASWVVRDAAHSLFFSGDSGYAEHFKEIGERFKSFDLAFIETGQYNERWHEVHMLPNESVQAYFDLNAKSFFPIHWGMFNLALHDWDEPIKLAAQASKDKNFQLVTPRLGQAIEISSSLKPLHWWTDSSHPEQLASTPRPVSFENL